MQSSGVTWGTSHVPLRNVTEFVLIGLSRLRSTRDAGHIAPQKTGLCQAPGRLCVVLFHAMHVLYLYIVYHYIISFSFVPCVYYIFISCLLFRAMHVLYLNIVYHDIMSFSFMPCMFYIFISSYRVLSFVPCMYSILVSCTMILSLSCHACYRL